MTTIIASISQSVANHDNPPSFQGGLKLNEAADALLGADYQFTQSYKDGGSYAVASGQTSISFDDGGAAILAGLAPAAGSKDGVVSVGRAQETTPETQRLDLQGTLNYHYAVSNGLLSFDQRSGTLNHIALATLNQPGSTQYDTEFGNSYSSLDGTISIADNGNFSGTITSFQAHNDLVVASSVFNGSFSVQGNTHALASGAASTAISGVLSGFEQNYSDGSYIRLDGGKINIDSATAIDESLLANPNNFSSDDSFDIALPAEMHSNWTIAAGDGNDTVAIRGGGTALAVEAGNGNDLITLGDDGHDVDGGAGFDRVVLPGVRSAYTITANKDGGFDVKNSSGVFDTLSGVERIQFNDASVALDIGGSAGQAYRVYQAAFNRAPDSGGLGYWINFLDQGISLRAVAEGFVGSAEFKGIYGANPSNTEIVGRFYQNVLHRAGDAGGMSFWVGLLDKHTLSVAEVLAGFSESAENQAALATLIGDGFTYLPFHG